MTTTDKTTVSETGYWIGDSDDVFRHHCFDLNLCNSLITFLKSEKINSVVDFGCGLGDYVKNIKKTNDDFKFNIDGGSRIDIDGFDGNPYTEMLTSGTCKILDLSRIFYLYKKYKWIICLEVGHHIPKHYESVFIKNLDNHNTEGIIISWPIEGQHGFSHINNRNNDYVKNIFANLGYTNDVTTENIFRTAASLTLFKNTIMVFRKNKLLLSNPLKIIKNDNSNGIVTIKLHGGLGNRIFQMAMAYSYSLKHNKKFIIYQNLIDVNPHSNINYFTNLFKQFKKYVINDNKPNDFHNYIEPHDKFSFFLEDEIPTNTNLYLEGYFLNEKYFLNVKEEFCEMLLDDVIIVDIKNKYDKLGNSFFIHIRGGFKIHEPNYNYVNLQNYYQKSLDYISYFYNLSNIHFYFLIDNIKYVEEQLSWNMFKNLNKTIVADNELNSLYIMSLCKFGGICSNSTFSWWGSYLNQNQNKIVCFPDKMVSPNIPSDIHYKGCVVIPVADLAKPLSVAKL